MRPPAWVLTPYDGGVWTVPQTRWPGTAQDSVSRLRRLEARHRSSLGQKPDPAEPPLPGDSSGESGSSSSRLRGPRRPEPEAPSSSVPGRDGASGPHVASSWPSAIPSPSPSRSLLSGTVVISSGSAACSRIIFPGSVQPRVPWARAWLPLGAVVLSPRPVPRAVSPYLLPTGVGGRARGHDTAVSIVSGGSGFEVRDGEGA